jgi:biotin operon repressor
MREVAVDLKLRRNVPWTQMEDAFEKETGVRWSYDKLRHVVRSHSEYSKKEPEQSPSAVLSAITKRAQTADEIAQSLNTTPRVIMAMIDDLRDDGYLINDVGGALTLCKVIVPQENVHTVAWNGDRIIRFGVVSDTHLASKQQQITHLETFYDLCQREGTKDIYHAGDITEGVNMRQGHQYEVFSQGSDEQEEYVIERYPKRDGIITHFITGNHDHSSIKNSGHDIGRRIAEKRKDMHYLGTSNAKVLLTPNCVMEVNHPLDGASYALSYTLQKTIDAMSGGEKPNILLNGHHHKALYLFYRNIHAFEAGTFQSQTPFMRGKRIPAHMGGWIIELHVSEDGTVTRCKGEFIPFYVAKERDW